VVWHPLAKATTQRPKARLKIDKIMAVKHSDFVARTPPFLRAACSALVGGILTL
jgi:hypothetical protein